MAKEEMVQKEGDLRAGASLTERELYDLLGEIGTKRKSVHPRILRDYPSLFECPQIAHRVKPAASDSERAHAAHSALSAAVTALPDPTDRLVGEAVLALGRFEGMRVDARKRVVASTDVIGCTEDSYKHRRQRVLRELCHFLLSDTIGPPRNVISSSPRSADSATRGSPHPLAEAAAELHFRALVTLFLVDFDKRLDNVTSYRDSQAVVWSECSYHFFTAFLDLVSGVNWFVTRNQARVGLSEARPSSSRQLPQSAIEAYMSLYDALLATGPRLDNDNIEEIMVYADGYLLAQEIEAYAIWNRWYQGIPYGGLGWTGAEFSSWLKDVERLAATAGHMEQLIVKHVDSPMSATARSRRRAYKALSYYFDLDENLPLIEGQSLRDWIESFFDTSRARLADESIVWYDNRREN